MATFVQVLCLVERVVQSRARWCSDNELRGGDVTHTAKLNPGMVEVFEKLNQPEIRDT